MFTQVCLKRGWFQVCFVAQIVITQRGGQDLNTKFMTFCKRLSFVYLSRLKFQLNKYWHKYAHMFEEQLKWERIPTSVFTKQWGQFVALSQLGPFTFFLSATWCGKSCVLCGHRIFAD